MLGVTGVTGAPGDVEAHWAWWRYGDAGVGAGRCRARVRGGKRWVRLGDVGARWARMSAKAERERGAGRTPCGADAGQERGTGHGAGRRACPAPSQKKGAPTEQGPSPAGAVRCRTRLAGTGVRATKKRGQPWAAPVCACDLLEVRDASLEEGLPLVAGDVLVDGVADALGVAHLAEHAAVGARDALDGEQRSVGVDGQVH